MKVRNLVGTLLFMAASSNLPALTNELTYPVISTNQISELNDIFSQSKPKELFLKGLALYYNPKTGTYLDIKKAESPFEPYSSRIDRKVSLNLNWKF